MVVLDERKQTHRGNLRYHTQLRQQLAIWGRGRVPGRPATSQVSYRTLWNAFKRVAASKGLDEAGKRMIFAGTAIKVYGLDLDV